jgi:hypothetical protein
MANKLSPKAQELAEKYGLNPNRTIYIGADSSSRQT